MNAKETRDVALAATKENTEEIRAFLKSLGYTRTSLTYHVTDSEDPKEKF